MSLTISVPDSLRASVEGASGGKQTVLYTALGQPTFMNVIPAMVGANIVSGLSANLNSLATNTHPAFVVNSIAKSEIFIGTYPGIVLNGELLSLPGVDPTTSVNHDNFVAYARACGTGHHACTNAEYAALALWCRANSYAPSGNTNYGASSDRTWESGRRVDGLAPGTASGNARIITGSGPNSWNHDNSPNGIDSLCGNIWEWSIGARVNSGEINIITDNDGALNATSLAAGSASWKAIDGATGALVAPGTAGTVRLATSGTTAYTLVCGSGAAFEGMTNPSGTPVGATALALCKAHGFYPVASQLGGTIATPAANGDIFYLNAAIEALPLRGGYWFDAAGAGVFVLSCSNPRTLSSTYLGARPAFVA